MLRQKAVCSCLTLIWHEFNIELMSVLMLTDAFQSLGLASLELYHSRQKLSASLYTRHTNESLEILQDSGVERHLQYRLHLLTPWPLASPTTQSWPAALQVRQSTEHGHTLLMAGTYAAFSAASTFPYTASAHLAWDAAATNSSRDYHDRHPSVPRAQLESRRRSACDLAGYSQDCDVRYGSAGPPGPLAIQAVYSSPTGSLNSLRWPHFPVAAATTENWPPGPSNISLLPAFDQQFQDAFRRRKATYLPCADSQHLVEPAHGFHNTRDKCPDQPLATTSALSFEAVEYDAASTGRRTGAYASVSKVRLLQSGRRSRRTRSKGSTASPLEASEAPLAHKVSSRPFSLQKSFCVWSCMVCLGCAVLDDTLQWLTHIVMPMLESARKFTASTILAKGPGKKDRATASASWGSRN